MQVSVCVGSSCHLKGAAQVIQKFQEMGQDSIVWEYNLEASFCRDRCQEGVIVSIDGVIYTRVTPQDVPELIKKHLKGEG